MICKLQRDIDRGERVLIYPRDHAYQWEGQATPEILEFMGRDHKVFVEGYVDLDGQFIVQRRVPDQAW
jgi:hypothetical protein